MDGSILLSWRGRRRKAAFGGVARPRALAARDHAEGCNGISPVTCQPGVAGGSAALSGGTRRNIAVKAALSRFRASVAGLSPETIALILVLGLVLGVFPVFGCPTLLCIVAALAFRLNLP